MLKGKSKIELTNVKSGEKQVYENENMITNAPELLSKVFNFKSAMQLFTLPIYKSLFGGVLLFPNTITEDKNNIFPSGNNIPFSCAGNIVNEGSRVYLGSFNTTESGIQSDGSVKIVWDFTTAQGNGTINALALTTGDGGVCGYGTTETTTCSTNASLLGKKINSWTNAFVSHDRPLLLDYDNEKVYYWTYTEAKNTNILIKCKDIHMKTYDISSSSFIEPNATTKTIQLNTTLQNEYPIYCNTSKNGKVYFIFSSRSTCEILSSEIFHVLEIDIYNNFTSKVYTLTNNTGQTLRQNVRTSCLETSTFITDNGYLLITGYNNKTIYKINLNDSTDTTSITTISNSYTCFRCQFGDVVYYNYYQDCLKGINVIDNSVKNYQSCPTYTFSFDTSGFYSWVVPVKLGNNLNNPFFFGQSGNSETTNAIMGLITNFMLTINNLSSPVIKTADNTMKITYTLTNL